LTTESRESKNLFSVTSTSTYLHESREFNESTRNSDLPFFDLNIIVAATDNFSVANKLGEGSFGPVYKQGRSYPWPWGSQAPRPGVSPKKKKKKLKFYP
jgi:hypothetical protein